METPMGELGEEVPLGELGKRLKQLWQSNEALSKAALVNFAIYSERVDSLAANTALIREVTREHACRALLIGADPGAAGVSVRVWITAHCQLTGGGKKSVCSEQIAFLVSGRGANLVPSTVFAWLESDLPLIFWWQGEFSERWEPHLYAVIDRLVIDSGEWGDPLPQMRRLEEAWRGDNGGFAVNDLNWTRVLGMRMAVAAAFDEPGALGHLARLERIEIDYGRGHVVAAKMLGAWMIHQGGWELVGGEVGEAGEERFVVRQRGREMGLVLRECGEGRAVSRVGLRGPEGVIELRHEVGSRYIEARVELGGGVVEQLTPCPYETPAELVTERLRRGCQTRRYFALLGTVRALLGEKGWGGVGGGA